jgi:hypothetical protein
LKNISGTSEHLEKLDISEKYLTPSTTYTVVRMKMQTENNGCYLKNVFSSRPVRNRPSSFPFHGLLLHVLWCTGHTRISVIPAVTPRGGLTTPKSHFQKTLLCVLFFVFGLSQDV